MTQEAAVQGQSILASSGDNGSQCGANFGTQLPASDPNVTAVGGTTLYAIGPGGAEPYAEGRTPLEAVWNNQIVSSSPTGTGGGISVFSAMPSYQSGAAASLGVINANSGGSCGVSDCREVPDVAADGDGGSGYVIYGHGAWKVIGGTSAATPLWSGYMALVNASRACRGATIGFANPSLYQLAGGGSGSTLFNDIVNASPRTGKNTNDAAGTHGGLYPLRTGYDMATGLGSMHGDALAAALCALRAPVYTVTVTAPAAQVSNIGSAVSLQLHGTDSGGLPLSYTVARTATRPHRVVRRSDLRQPHHWRHLHSHCQRQRRCDQQREHSLHMDGPQAQSADRGHGTPHRRCVASAEAQLLRRGGQRRPGGALDHGGPSLRHRAGPHVQVAAQGDQGEGPARPVGVLQRHAASAGSSSSASSRPSAT